MSAQAGSPERPAQGQAGTGPPALARYWWVTGLRGLVGLMLAVAIVVVGHDTARLVTFLALYWMTGDSSPSGSLWRSGHIVGSGWDWWPGAWRSWARCWWWRVTGCLGWWIPEVLIVLLGISASLTGLLRVLGGFATQERPGRQWTLGGIVLGTLELAFGVLVLTSTADPDLLVPLVAVWGAVSGILLLAEGLRLRRLARIWRPPAPETLP